MPIVTWTIEEPDPRFKDYTIDELEELKRFYFDRWNWETGSKEDRELFEAIEEEIELRTILHDEDVHKELLSEEIRKEIDAEILKDILRMSEKELKMLTSK